MACVVKALVKVHLEDLERRSLHGSCNQLRRTILSNILAENTPIYHWLITAAAATLKVLRLGSYILVGETELVLSWPLSCQPIRNLVVSH